MTGKRAQKYPHLPSHYVVNKGPNQFSGERKFFLTNGAETTRYSCAKKKKEREKKEDFPGGAVVKNPPARS